VLTENVFLLDTTTEKQLNAITDQNKSKLWAQLFSNRIRKCQQGKEERKTDNTEKLWATEAVPRVYKR